ncbi:MAG: HPr family phosphocarrier protein [Clostridiales bacterium]|nr:HPr family phosphocarrier protein [Clostridiales bacterium]
MTKKQIKIGLASGLEARPIAVLVQIASQFESSIYVDIGNKRVNAKSIMGMMTIAMDTGDEITISADGPDEETAMAGIEKYLRGEN